MSTRQKLFPLFMLFSFLLVGCNLGVKAPLESMDSPDSFITVWKSNASGPMTEANTITLPLTQKGNYDFVVNWGDGSSDTITSWNDFAKTHKYLSSGTYKVTMNGKFDQLSFRTSPHSFKLLKVLAWGSNHWVTMNSMFYGCSDLQVTATDIPDLSNVTDMSSMFYRATNFNKDIKKWDTSKVTNMSYMFYGAASFNQDINGLDTGSVTNMTGMFSNALSFNQNISSWNVSKVTTMAHMFHYAKSFNQDLRLWNTSNIKNMSYMFYGATNFNQEIGSWDTANVENMMSMFNGAVSFNQDLSSWNVSNVEKNKHAYYNFNANAWSLNHPSFNE